MKPLAELNWVNISPEAGHYAFGYYDRCPWDRPGGRHLAMKFTQQERLPALGERAEIGFFEGTNGIFNRVMDTRAWCHQQGSMTLWLKHLPDTFIYNDFIESDNKLKTVIFDINKGIQGYYDQPVYVTSPDGHWGASLDFSRIPRRGYSYADVPLEPDKRMPDLDSDGLFIVDMESKESKLIACYRQFLERHPLAHDTEDMYCWLNHAGFNSDSSRVMVLFRQCRNPLDLQEWRTHLFTMNIDGSDLRCVLPDIYWRNSAISHQLWGRTPGEILLDAEWRGQGHEYLVVDENDRDLRSVRISPGMGPMGHLIFSPDGKWLAADTYPDGEGIQTLAMVRVADGELKAIGRFNHRWPIECVDVRCDLHPRWSQDSKLLTVDTIHEGERKIYMLDIMELSERFDKLP